MRTHYDLGNPAVLRQTGKLQLVSECFADLDERIEKRGTSDASLQVGAYRQDSSSHYDLLLGMPVKVLCEYRQVEFVAQIVGFLYLNEGADDPIARAVIDGDDLAGDSDDVARWLAEKIVAKLDDMIKRQSYLDQRGNTAEFGHARHRGMTALSPA